VLPLILEALPCAFWHRRFGYAHRCGPVNFGPFDAMRLLLAAGASANDTTPDGSSARNQDAYGISTTAAPKSHMSGVSRRGISRAAPRAA